MAHTYSHLYHIPATGLRFFTVYGPMRRPDMAYFAGDRINIGNNSPERLMTFIGALEKALGKALGRDVEFNKVYEPIKPGDVPATYASTDKLYQAVGFKPETSIEEGSEKFAEWYVRYYGVE